MVARSSADAFDPGVLGPKLTCQETDALARSPSNASSSTVEQSAVDENGAGCACPITGNEATSNTSRQVSVKPRLAEEHMTSP